MRRCAFLTLDERADFVIDDEHAIAPLAELGWQVETLSWRQKVRPWSEFDAVIIRSTWDYWNDVAAFLEALAQINRQSRLANPLDLVHWNLAKTYLRDLEGKGVGVVPTLWLDGLSDSSPGVCAERLGTDELVVKPVIGANGQDAFRFGRRGVVDSGDTLDQMQNRRLPLQLAQWVRVIVDSATRPPSSIVQRSVSMAPETTPSPIP